MNALSLTLLGQFQALSNGRSISSFRTRKVQALLIYLVVESQPHRRESLMELLWPGMPEQSARQNLRQIIYNLRQALPELAAAEDDQKKVPLLLTNRQTIQVNPLADVTVDVGEVEDILGRVRLHSHVDLLTCHACQADLMQVADLYNGDFLSDFYLDDSNKFEEWVASHRHILQRQTLDTLETLATIFTRQKAYPEARAYAERQLEIDDLRESGYRQLMEILALAGQREEALTLYERCRRQLAEELGMAPTKRTTAIYNKIVAGDLRFDAPQTQGVRGYELKEEIGAGAYGTIYRAIQPTISRDVAVKVIRRKYANDPTFIRRFEAEAQTIARLEHPYIVPLYDYWRDPEGAYLVMRLLRGGNLLTSLEQGPWSVENTLKMVDQISSALSAAHQQGIVHRDIKPANILFDESGNAYLSDFGIAKDLTLARQLTAEANLMGTPDYISPEQLRNEPLTLQADLYSLGAVLFEMLTGERPFSDLPFALRFQKHLQEPLPLISTIQPGLPAQVDEVIQQATAKRPADRYPNALAMAEAFRRAVRGATLAPVTVETAVAAHGEMINPYKGLRAFQESDAADFYGRDKLVQQLLLRLAKNRFLAVVGPSGSGKSSLVKAGLIPALRQEALPGSDKWFVAEMVPGSHPLEELELALLPIAVDPPPSLLAPLQKDERGLLRTIRRILPAEDGAALLLIIDQFEELFTLVEDDDRRQHFLNSLIAALNAPRSHLRVVVTLRADFYDRPLQIQATAELFKQHAEVVLPLNRDELTWAIQEPAQHVGVGFEDTVLSAIVAEVHDQPGALPLLQYALTELFDARTGNQFTRAAFDEIGGVLGALPRRADEIYDSLSADEKVATRQFFLRLITLGEGVEDTRRRVLISELTALNLENEQNPNGQVPIREIINRYGEARLLTFDHDPLTRQPTVEVAHEALLREWEQLRTWLEESRDDVRLQRLLATAVAEWTTAGQDTGFLLRGGRLDLFANWSAETDLALTQEEQQFLKKSLAARREREGAEEKRLHQELETVKKLAATERQRAEEQVQAAGRLRRRALLLTGALVIAALLAIAALFFANQSNQNATEALSNANLAATNEAQAVTNADLAGTREIEANANAELAALNEAEAIANANLALTREAEAETQRTLAVGEAEQRAIAQAEAEQESKIAISRELAAGATNNLEPDPELSILLALQGLTLTHTLEAESALHIAIQSSSVRQTFVPERGLGSAFVVYNPNGHQVFVSGPGGGSMWDVTTGEVMYTYPVPEGDWVNIAAFSPDGTYLILPIESYDGNIPLPSQVAILDAATGQKLVEFPAHEQYIQVSLVSPDGKLFATLSIDETIMIWDLEATLAAGTGQLVNTLCCFPGGAVQGAFSPDSKTLVVRSSGEHHEGSVWDIASGESLFTLDSLIVNDIDFSPDGNYLITGGQGIIEVWEAATGQLLSTTVAHGGNTIHYIGFSPDGTQVATTTSVGEVGLWDFSPEGQQEIRQLVGHDGRVHAADFSPDGHFLITTGLRDGTARLWDITPAGNSELNAIAGHEDVISDLRLIKDDSQLVTIGLDGMLKIWDLDSGEELVALQAHDGWIERMDISPNGRILATTNDDGTIKLWDTNTWELVRTLEGHRLVDINNFYTGAIDVVFSPDGNLLASSGGDGDIILWDPVTGERLLTMTGHIGWVRDIVFSPNGTLLASAGVDGILRLWDIATGQNLLSIDNGQSSRYFNLDFSPDGSHLLAGRQDSVVEMWELPENPWQPGDEGIKLIYAFESQAGSIYSTRINADGSQMVISGRSGIVEIRDPATSELHLTMQLQTPVGCAYLTEDENRLVTCGDDGIVRFFALDYQELIDLAQSRVTRALTEAECQQYLHVDACPAE